ncbi:hypothetical protein ACOTTU_22680 [Roseobacter sp. EG26]|uniref:hypothetical protein n=1 Tax=Roseobacter sp. EG26 TaxID=3412477 RepID=UPI003CE52E98
MVAPIELFRYFVGRAPRPRRIVYRLILAELNTTFSRDILAAAASPRAREAVRSVSRAHIAQNTATQQLDDIERRFPLRRFAESWDNDAPDTLGAARAMVLAIFNRPVEDVVGDDEFNRIRDILRDLMIALKLAVLPESLPIRRASDMLRASELLLTLHQNPEAIDFEDSSALLKAVIALPPELFPPADPVELEEEPEPPEEDPTTEKLEERAKRLELAAAEVVGLSGSGIERVRRARVATGGPDALSAGGRESTTGRTATTAAAARLSDEADDISDEISFIGVSQAAVGRLSSDTQDLLAELDVDITGRPYDEVLDRIEVEHQMTTLRLIDADAADGAGPRIRTGSAVMPAAGTASPLFPGMGTILDPSSLPPTTVGPIKPIGVGDLLVTRQQIKRYEAGEISHVENVLQSESRNRETRRLRRTEETFVFEEEEKKEEERDLQTTERLEMQSEIQNTLREDKQFNIGGSVSAGYGPFVQVEVSSAYETGTSQEQINKLATSYAKEVTERTASKVALRTRREQTRKTIEEFEEKNQHGFDNTEGTEHLSGIYQWLDRVYELQVYNYGLRVLFEFVVPEPSALLLRAIEHQIGKPEGLKPPRKPSFGPGHLTRTNYGKYVRRYEAEGVQPPPAFATRIGKSFTFTSQSGEAEDNTSEALLNVPEGFKAVSCSAKILHYGFTSDTRRAYVSVGSNSLHLKKRAEGSASPDSSDLHDTLPEIAGEVPVAFYAVNVLNCSATVTIHCVHTQAAFEKWQVETYDALLRGYDAQRGRYEEKLAILKAERSGAAPEGRNPGQNRLIERREIKRLSIAMMTGQHFANTGVHLSPQAAEFNFDAAERAGVYARFWEKAIQWNELQWELLPYFWTSRDTWARMLYEDTDPLHAEFISAGAALVRFAVSPGYEAAVLHFLETGGVWEGGDEPSVTSEEYAAMLDEVEAVRNRETGDGPLATPEGSGEIPVGDPWEIRVPTTLVKLRQDNALPEWVKDEDGRWHPVDQPDD